MPRTGGVAGMPGRSGHMGGGKAGVRSKTATQPSLTRLDFCPRANGHHGRVLGCDVTGLKFRTISQMDLLRASQVEPSSDGATEKYNTKGKTVVFLFQGKTLSSKVSKKISSPLSPSHPS